MSAELDRIKNEIAFYNEVGPLEQELEEAREVKKSDPVRFAEAKQVFEEKRRFYRQIAEFLKAEATEASDDDSNTTISIPAIEIAGITHEAG